MVECFRGSNAQFHEVTVDYTNKTVKFNDELMGWTSEVVTFLIVLFAEYLILDYWWVFITEYSDMLGILTLTVTVSVALTFLLHKWTLPLLTGTYSPDNTYIRNTVDPRKWKEYKLTPAIIKSKVVEIENIGNIFTQYFCEGDFNKYLQKFEIKLMDKPSRFKKISSFGTETEFNWFFRITFSRIPKTGFMLIQNQKDFYTND